MITVEQFQANYNLPLDGMVEQKQSLSYLSWSYAFKLLKERHPGYTVKMESTEVGVPYHRDPAGAFVLAYLVDEKGNESPSLYFPVLDMRMKPVVEPDSTQVNKAIMRAAVKVIALYTGLGLPLYTGEDLPETPGVDGKPKTKPPAAAKRAAHDDDDI